MIPDHEEIVMGQLYWDAGIRPIIPIYFENVAKTSIFILTDRECSACPTVIFKKYCYKDFNALRFKESVKK